MAILRNRKNPKYICDQEYKVLYECDTQKTMLLFSLLSLLTYILFINNIIYYSQRLNLYIKCSVLCG